MSDDEVVLIRIVDAARLMSISRSRAYSLALRGKLPGALRLGGTWRVNRRVLDTWAAGAANPGADARILAEPSVTSRSDG
jgi:excisionase family DNA binding protein